MPLAAIPPRMINAVMAIEDRRFYDHPGVDPIATARRRVSAAIFGKSEMRGGQHAHPAAREEHVPDAGGSLRAQDDRVVHVDRRSSGGCRRTQILELYLNDVWLGQRGSFAIHGVAEAARLFFGKDIS